MLYFDSDTVPRIVVIGILAACIIGIIAIIASAVKNRKKELDSSEEVYDEHVPEPEGEYARVMSKRIEDGYSGSYKVPKYQLLFIVTFLTDRGETKEFSVSEETYQRITEHQTGMLITLDGNFFDFGDGEEPTE